MIDDSTARGLEGAALSVLSHAWAPYSRFRVGAALLDAEGRIHVGCNVENASLGLSICAERSAVFRAVAEGAREFVAVAIASDAETLTPPCGACRQVLLEFAPHLQVLLVNSRGERRSHSLEELLPLAFHDFRVEP
jgi:cytidine deaminase